MAAVSHAISEWALVWVSMFGLPEAVAVGVAVIAGMGVWGWPRSVQFRARRISACFLMMSACDLTFDMRGRPQVGEAHLWSSLRWEG